MKPNRSQVAVWSGAMLSFRSRVHCILILFSSFFFECQVLVEVIVRWIAIFLLKAALSLLRVLVGTPEKQPIFFFHCNWYAAPWSKLPTSAAHPLSFKFQSCSWGLRTHKTPSKTKRCSCVVFPYKHCIVIARPSWKSAEFWIHEIWTPCAGWQKLLRYF